MESFNYVILLRNNKDIEENISLITKLLFRLNKEKCILKYNFYLAIIADDITFNDENGVIKPINDSIFDKYDLPYTIFVSPNMDDKGLSHSSKKELRIYSNKIKFYKRFNNFQISYILIIKEIRENFLFFKEKGVISMKIRVELRHR